MHRRTFALLGALLLAHPLAGAVATPAHAEQLRAPHPETPAHHTQGSLPPVMGGDVSSLPKSEDLGAVYHHRDGRQADALTILADEGMNYARLRVWVDPADGYNTAETVLDIAPRVKDLGMGLLIDFHYSDFWADPGRQDKPAAWESHTFPELRDAVYDHTHELVAALAAQGTPADIVQVGNEINGGMLWPEGSTDNWPRLAELLNAGARAVRDASSDTEVMLHLAEGGDNGLFRWWFDQAVAHGVDFDLIGASYYPYWHGSLADLRNNLNDVAARYRRDVMVVETAYGFTLKPGDQHPNIFDSSLRREGGYPATPQGQAGAFRDVADVVAAVPNGRGRGVIYWEPTWVAVEGNGWDPTDPASGNAWENQALFDYSHTVLPAAGVFGED